MNRVCPSLSLTLALSAALFLTTASMAEVLKVGGTGAVTEVLMQLAPAFRAETGVDLQIVPGLGTTGGNNALADGKIGVSFSGRPLRDTEKANGLKVAIAFRTPFGFVTSRAGPDNFRKSEVVSIFLADNPRWPDGAPVLITLRPVDESDNIVLGEMFPGIGDAFVSLRKRRDLSVAATDQDNADVAEKNKGSLTSATYVQIVSERRRLQFVSIDGVPPTLENYRNGSYPYSKDLFAVVPPLVSSEAAALIAFLGGQSGRRRLEAAGLLIVE
jgi:phosphate transport system substrate-binding protein